jgi:hypothetical protein
MGECATTASQPAAPKPGLASEGRSRSGQEDRERKPTRRCMMAILCSPRPSRKADQPGRPRHVGGGPEPRALGEVRGVPGSVKSTVWSEEAVEHAAAALADDFTPIDDHRSSAWYRATVAANLLRGFYTETLASYAPGLPDRPSGTVLPGGAP